MKKTNKTGNLFSRHGWSVVMALLFMPMLASAQYQVAFNVSGGNGTTSPSGFQNLAAPYTVIDVVPDRS